MAIPPSAFQHPPSSPAPNGTAHVANMTASTPTPAVGAPAQTGLPLSSLPPAMQAMLAGMTKERITQMIQRMQTLRAQGATEQTSQELVKITQILRVFQHVQNLRTQQQQQAQQQAQSQAMAAQMTSANGTAAPLVASTPASAASVSASSLMTGVSTPATTLAGSMPTAMPTTATVTSAPFAAVDASGLAAAAAASSPAAPTSFSREQLETLKYQIMAYRLLSRNLPLPPQLQAAIYAPNEAVKQLSADEKKLEQLGISSKIIDAAVAKSQAARAQQELHMKKDGSLDADAAGPSTSVPPRSPSPVDDPKRPTYPYNAFTNPWSYLRKPGSDADSFMATKQQRLLVPSLLPAGLDPKTLLEERDRFTQARIRQRIRELEGLPANFGDRAGSADGPGSDKGKENESALNGHYPASGAPRIKALIELKSLHLLEKQRALREEVVRNMSQATTLALDRTAFRRFKKQTLRDARMTEQLERKQRTEREKRAKQKHNDYLASICNHGRDLMSAHRAAQQAQQKIGKMVLKLHADTEKEEQKRIERISKERLRALKADDEEAYLKLIDTAKDTRITHLLRQTDSYLDSLAQAVMAQQNDDVHADVIAAERQRGGATIEPIDETAFGARRDEDLEEKDGDKKDKVDYYAVAHRITEKVEAQPSILVGGTLKDYQLKGLQWMVSLYNNRLNGILADEMGLGKTIQTISLITFLIEVKKHNGPYLVIVPLSTLSNWTLEFERWAPAVTKIVYKGTPPVRRNLQSAIRHGQFQVLLTTYEYIIKDKHLLGKVKWLHMIIDEGHRMKNTQSKLTLTLTQYYNSRYRLILTGTPLQNNLPELWALLNFVLPKIFNSVKSFDEWFNTPFANTGASGDNMQLNEEEALLIIRRLHKVLRPFLLRRLKKDVESELPEKQEKVVRCKMSALQWKLYQQMKKHGMLFSTDGSNMKGKPVGIKGLQNAIMQLRKICNHPYVFEEVERAVNPTKMNGPDLYRVAGKFELLDRILPKLKRTGHRVLVFFQMTQIMNIMEDYLQYRGHKYLRLDGSTKPDDRSMMVRDFNAPNSEYFVFILSTRAGGLGLNLQSADTVIIYDSDWNPHQDLQAQDRAHRIGQKQAVRILRLVTEKSVEEQILARAQFKLEIDGKVIQAGKFDNQTSAEDREEFLRAMLEADQDDGDEEDGDLDDDELNELLKRGEHEIEIFHQMDVEREQEREREWKAHGGKGPRPERLIQESELPEIYQIEHEDPSGEGMEEELPATRKRTNVHYDDGLTEDQWLNALENSDDDVQEAIQRKRERKARRMAKKGVAESSTAVGTPGSDVGSVESPGPGKRKRGRVSGGNDEEETPGPAGKKRKPNDDPVREQLRLALLKCYKAVESCHDVDGRRRCNLFLEVPSAEDYPDYHQIIKQPMAMRKIKRRLDNRSYRFAWELKEHFLLMFNNAKTYNQEGSWVYNDAVEMEKAFLAAYEQFVASTDLPGAQGEGPEEAPAAATPTRGGKASRSKGRGKGRVSKGRGKAAGRGSRGSSLAQEGDEGEEEGIDQEDGESVETPAPAPAPRLKVTLGRGRGAKANSRSVPSTPRTTATSTPAGGEETSEEDEDMPDVEDESSEEDD